MAFFKKLADSASDSMHISKLDKIVDRRVEQFEQEIQEIIKNQNRIYSEEEIERFEKDAIAQSLQKYDEEARREMGRDVAANWEEGGGDVEEVRKRMLNRRLQERRGQLAASIHEGNNKARTHLEELMIVIQNSESQCAAAFPTDLGTITCHYDQLRDQLHQQIVPHYSQGYDYFNTFTNGALQLALDQSKERVIDLNCSRRHDQEVDTVIQGIQSLLSEEEMNLKEDEVIDGSLAKFDEDSSRTSNCSDRRERLKEALVSRRGRIVAAANEKNSQAEAQLEAMKQMIQTHVDGLRGQLPTNAETIDASFQALHQQLHDSLTSSYSGYDSFNAFVKNALGLAVEEAKGRVVQEDAELAQQAIKAFRHKALTDLKNSLLAQLTTTGDSMKSLLGNSEDINRLVVTDNVIDSVKSEIDVIVEQCVEVVNNLPLFN